MIAHARLVAALPGLILLAGCFGDSGLGMQSSGPIGQPPSMGAVPGILEPRLERVPPQEERAKVSPEDALQYARRVVPMIAGRTLREEEVTRLEAEGGAALMPLIEGWVQEAGFADSARMLISLKLKASGTRDGIDLNLPGNLAAHLVRQKRPWAEILTASSCVNASGEEVVCDTGAPYAAGVLATRAFLSNNAGRFNLKRARTLMTTFACRDYPMERTLQPPLEREVLIPLFQQDKAANEDGVGAFGNGFACYTCHSQFGAHAQLFVKFDETGRWISDATGQQDPAGEPGRSLNGLFTSHMLRPEDAASEGSQIFGEQVTNLAEAGRVISRSDAFLGCTARSLVGLVFGMSEAGYQALPATVIDEVVARSREREPEPSLLTIAAEALGHPSMIFSFGGAQ